MDNQRTSLFGREQWCLVSNVGQFRQALMNVSATQGQSLPFSPLNTLIHSKYGLSHTVAARTVALQLCVWPLEIDLTRHVIMTVIV